MAFWTRWFRKSEPEVVAAPAPFDPETATVDELIAENQRLALEQDAIKAQRRALAERIDAKLTGG